MKISIIDTGIGISEEGINKLFVDFGKLNESSERNKGGTGLGLSICKKIIEQMGGSVKVTSKLGVGSEFIINIKMKCIVKKTKLEAEEEKSEAINLSDKTYHKFISTKEGKIVNNI